MRTQHLARRRYFEPAFAAFESQVTACAGKTYLCDTSSCIPKDGFLQGATSKTGQSGPKARDAHNNGYRRRACPRASSSSRCSALSRPSRHVAAARQKKSLSSLIRSRSASSRNTQANSNKFPSGRPAEAVLTPCRAMSFTLVEGGTC